MLGKIENDQAMLNPVDLAPSNHYTVTGPYSLQTAVVKGETDPQLCHRWSAYTGRYNSTGWFGNATLPFAMPWRLVGRSMNQCPMSLFKEYCPLLSTIINSIRNDQWKAIGIKCVYGSWWNGTNIPVCYDHDPWYWSLFIVINGGLILFQKECPFLRTTL